MSSILFLSSTTQATAAMQVSQLLSFRLLRCSTSLFHNSLRRAFPFTLEYSALSSTSRTLSYRTSGIHVRAASSGKEARSLIDDEAELSDWVGDLKESNIMHSGINSGKEDGDRRSGGRGRDRDFGMGVGGRGERTGVLNSRGVSSKRRREVEFGSVASHSKKISGKFLLDSDEDDDEDEEDEDEVVVVDKRPRGGTRGSQMRSSRRRDLDMDRLTSPIAKTSERRATEMGVRKIKYDDNEYDESDDGDDDDDDESDDEFGTDDEDVKGTIDFSKSSIEPAVGNHGMTKSTSSKESNASSYLSQTRYNPNFLLFLFLPFHNLTIFISLFLIDCC